MYPTKERITQLSLAEFLVELKKLNIRYNVNNILNEEEYIVDVKNRFERVILVKKDNKYTKQISYYEE